ncbi:hypothetical protein GCM10010246_52060 [Streptomyces cuspidosporus]|uniref:Uncharacterized protein n=1 Tax=Streptomyces cuspidosporus TaxID=66882 RepID=A0ABN3GNE1_9ACTN
MLRGPKSGLNPHPLRRAVREADLHASVGCHPGADGRAGGVDVGTPPEPARLRSALTAAITDLLVTTTIVKADLRMLD